MKNNLQLLGALLLIIIGFVIGMFTGKKVYHQDIVEKTIVKIDTVVVHKPVPAETKPVETKHIKIIKHDTIYNESVKLVYIDGEPSIKLEKVSKRYYNPELYDLWISGIEPSLDSINIFNKVITNEFIIKPKNQLNAFMGTDFYPSSDNALSFKAGVEWLHTSGFSLSAGYLHGFKPNIDKSTFSGVFVGASYKFPLVK